VAAGSGTATTLGTGLTSPGCWPNTASDSVHMFATRMRIAAATVALAVAAPLVAATGAVADQTGLSTAGAAQEKGSRVIYLKGKEPREGVFVAYGRVEPGYKKRPAVLQRKLKSENRWSDWKRFDTDGQSTYRERIAALKRPGVVCYRVKVPGNETFKTSFSRNIENKSFSQVCIKTS